MTAGESAGRRDPALGDQDRPVNHGGQNGSVGNHQKRWRVDYDMLEAFHEFCDELPHRRGRQHFGRIGRRRAGRKDRERSILDLSQSLIKAVATRENTTEAFCTRQVELPRDSGLPEVRIDDQDGHAVLGE